MSVSDVGPYIVQSLGFLAMWLERVFAPWPWPFVMTAGALVLISLINFVVWFLRGMVWPVRCKYPKTTKRVSGDQACRAPVAGEWGYCRDHNSKWKTVGSHYVNPKLPRWMTYDSSGQQVERSDLRVAGHRVSLLFYRGHARPPLQVLTKGVRDVYIEWGFFLKRVQRLFVRRRSLDAASIEPHLDQQISVEDLEAYRGVHSRAVSADQALGALKIFLPIAAVISGVSAFLSGTPAVVVSYVAVFFLWVVVKIVQCGLWRVSDDGLWVAKTIRGVLRDFAIFVVVSVGLYYVATVVMPYLALVFAM